MSNPRRKRANERVHVGERRSLLAAAVVVGALAVITALVFGLYPSGGGYTVRGQFSSSTNLVPGSAVRIAGVDVGKVEKIERGPGNTSIVTMDVSEDGRPVHADATLAIEPRLLLEGNFYINVEPGSPSSPKLPSGALIPVQQTSVPVQLDQVLNLFDRATRESLTNSITNLADALGPGPTGRTGYIGARETAKQLDGALDAIRDAARQARGTQPGDLGRSIRGTRDVAVGLTPTPAILSNLVSDYSTVAAALAAEARPLQASVAKLNATLRVAPRALASLERVLPDVTRFGDALVPALRAAPKRFDQASAILDQIHALASDRELGGLERDLRPLTSRLPGYESELARLLPQLTDATRCLTKRVIPVLSAELSDDKLSTGDPIWLDLLHAATGITSSTGGFDGNGSAVRAGLTGGPTSLTGVFPGIGDVAGLGPRVTGVRPRWLGPNYVPPFRPDARCTEQPMPELDQPAALPPSWMRQTSLRRGGR